MRYNSSKHVFMYKGDLNEEIRKCKKQLATLEKELPYYQWILESAQYDYNTRKKKIDNLKEFIRLATEKLENPDKEETDKNE